MQDTPLSNDLPNLKDTVIILENILKSDPTFEKLTQDIIPKLQQNGLVKLHKLVGEIIWKKDVMSYTRRRMDQFSKI
jgi:hypothetical protein